MKCMGAQNYNYYPTDSTLPHIFDDPITTQGYSLSSGIGESVAFAKTLLKLLYIIYKAIKKTSHSS